VHRVARQLGYGTEPARSWVRQADVDEGHTAGVRTIEARRMRQLEQENRELRRAKATLKRAASFFGTDPTANMTCSRIGRALSLRHSFYENHGGADQEGPKTQPFASFLVSTMSIRIFS
jgi:transposase-like protein